ncbi:hypothetical protein QCA50_000910 [Cerrena zonata]|uniref:Thioredoxin-like fold domain-containing protein n=1 Tax=Cerrena zonata TaxID=2478898 RepID=A0AAW0GVP2_9APHY
MTSIVILVILLVNHQELSSNCQRIAPGCVATLNFGIIVSVSTNLLRLHCIHLVPIMALQPSLRPLIIAGSHDAPHTLDIFLDYVCPFSAKIALAIDSILVPLFAKGGKYDGKVKVIFRNQVQPWHASSTWVHESGLAVARVSPENFWPFSLALFKRQGDFFDIPTSSLTPIQVRQKLAALAAEVIGGNSQDAVLNLITLKSSPNGGVDVTDDLKYTIKFSRQNGIHVSPTVLWDGLVANEISSSWGEKEWTEFLEKKVAV